VKLLDKSYHQHDGRRTSIHNMNTMIMLSEARHQHLSFIQQ